MPDNDRTDGAERFLPPDEVTREGERRHRMGSGLAADPFMPPGESALPLDELPDSAFAPPATALPVEAELPTLEVEAKGERTRNAIAERVKNEPKIRAGCSCKKRYDIWLDDDFGGAAKWLAGGIGIGTAMLMYWAGVFFTLAAMFGMAATGGAVTITSVCMRCEGCRGKITDLDADESDNVRLARRRITMVTVVLAACAVACGAIWVWRYTAPMLPVL